MKKLFVLSLMFALPLVTNASSFVMTPSSGSYTSGDMVTLRISVDPAGSTIYTAMLDAKFSPDTFEVISFTLNDAMLAMKQAGYDSMDNTNGILIKTGGFAGGISSLTSFGTLVLKAKTSGTATFTANSSSKLLDSNNTNKQVGSQSVSFTIVNKIPVIETQVEVKKTTETNTKVVAPVKKQTPAKTTDAKLLTNTQATTSQVATVGQSGAVNVMTLALIFLAMVGSFGAGYFVGRRKSLNPII